MCGIAGHLNAEAAGRLGSMLESLTHRGPDDEGRFSDAEHSLYMGARRLSIVDLEGGSQPISNEDGTVTVAFNGEIYNYRSLKSELEAEGHRFRTDCDTEVLVHLWEEYGTAMPTHLHGMFAFSIWDSNEETLFLCRDRIGIKPLFVYQDGETVLWASEMAALFEAGIDMTVDPLSVRRYFSFQHSLQPDTLIESVRKLPPGHSMTVSEDDITTRRYWELDQSPTTKSTTAIATEIRELLEKSVRKRLMGDVPVGAFLSGGLDSSAIVGLMAEEVDDVRTFSIGFAGSDVDESEEAEHVAAAFGTDHTEVNIDLSLMDTFGDVVRTFGEPLADPAMLPTQILSRRARDDLKVVMTGEGADELFGGYERYRRISRHQPLLGKLPSTVLDAIWTVGDYSGVYDRHFRYLGSHESATSATIAAKERYEADPGSYLDGVPDDSFDDVADTISDGPGPLQHVEAFDIKYHLPDRLLYKVDHTTMAASLEARVPYLDHELVELATSIPKEIKLDGDYKPLLRKAVSDIVPDRTLERNKQPFVVPVERWFRRDHDGIMGWLSDEHLDKTPYIRTEHVFSLLDAHREGRADHSLLLWKYLNYVAWYITHVSRRR